MFNKTQLILTNIEDSLNKLTIQYQNEIKEIKEELDELEKQKKEFLEVKQLVDISLIADPITLNVGGIEFQTSKSTLQKVPGSYFDTMLSGQINIQPMTGRHNTYFIDRDGTHFRYVLNYLRDGPNTPIPQAIKEELGVELRFYRISTAYELLDFDQIRLIEGWIGTGPKKFELLYRGTRDGFKSSTFHEKCDNKGPTVSVIKSTDGSIFGGYASQSWPSDTKYFGDNNFFIFTLRNIQEILPTKYLPSGADSNFGFSRKDLGITFGVHDIVLSDQCNTNNTSYQKFPHSYVDTTGKGKITLASTEYITISEVEVFKLT